MRNTGNGFLRHQGVSILEDMLPPGGARKEFGSLVKIDANHGLKNVMNIGGTMGVIPLA